MQAAEEATYAKFISTIDALPYWFPWETDAVQLKSFPNDGDRISRLAREVTPIIDASVPCLLEDFINAKVTSGTPTEKDVYGSMDPLRLLTRLLHNRPISFWGSQDRHCLRTAFNNNGSLDDKHWGGFEAIGTTEEQAPLLLRDYISYDEMCLAALVSVFVPTLFINDGDRKSWCKTGAPESFEREGVMVGCVGARLVNEDTMEARFMLVTKAQNTAGKGYGSESQDPLLRLWAKFYGVEYFPTYEEVAAKPGNRFHLIEPWGQEDEYGGSSVDPQFLDTLVYSKRIRRVVAPFLIKASNAGVTTGCHVRVKGLGLGVWQVDPLQETLMLEIYAEVLRSTPLPGIKVLEFAWFPTAKSLGGVPDLGQFSAHGGRDIEIRFTRNGFAAPVAEGQRLIAMYAWDGNAFPGNEWWSGRLGSTDDSAAASCSLISSLQNPDVNGARLSGDVTEVMADDGRFFILPDVVRAGQSATVIT